MRWCVRWCWRECGDEDWRPRGGRCVRRERRPGRRIGRERRPGRRIGRERRPGRRTRRVKCSGGSDGRGWCAGIDRQRARDGDGSLGPEGDARRNRNTGICTASRPDGGCSGWGRTCRPGVAPRSRSDYCGGYGSIIRVREKRSGRGSSPAWCRRFVKCTWWRPRGLVNWRVYRFCHPRRTIRGGACWRKW